MEIYYSGTGKQVKQQKICVHDWVGPLNDCKGTYYTCALCHCSKREDVEDVTEKKRKLLHRLCAAYVHSIQLDYHFREGGGIVTLSFQKHRPSDPRDKTYREPEQTDISFPFDRLTITDKSA
jgi:hypothetical protein